MNLPTPWLLLPLLAMPLAVRAETPHVSIGRVVSAGADVIGVQNGFSGALHVGDPIAPDERIETGDNSVTVLLHEGTVSAAVKIKPHSRVKVSAEPGHGILAQLETGALLSDVHNPEKTAHPYTIRTRTAVMGVRGTVFFVKEQPGQSAFLCTCHGEVELAGVSKAGEKDSGPAQLIQGVHHDHPVLIREDTADTATALSARTTPAPQGSDHSDNEAADLEKVLSAQK